MSDVMDKLDTIFVNSRLKKWTQTYFEFPILNSFLKSEKIDIRNKVILDAGCGAGHGLEIIHRFYCPSELYGFDVLKSEVEIAKKVKVPANVFVANILNTKLPKEKFDAIFVFEVLHHVPKWRSALKELSRILKPGGALLIIELSKFGVKFARTWFGFTHPKEASFEWYEFHNGLKDAGFMYKKSKLLIWQAFGFFLYVKS